MVRDNSAMNKIVYKCVVVVARSLVYSVRSVSAIYVLVEEVFNVLKVARLCHCIIVTAIWQLFPDFCAPANLIQSTHVCGPIIG